MKRLVKWLLLLAIVATLLGSASYAGARLRVGQLVGSEPPLGGRDIAFAWKGVEELPDRPRAWIFTYRTNQLRLRLVVKIYISPTGDIIQTVPSNLAARIEAYERSRRP